MLDLKISGGTIVDGIYDLKEFRIYPPGSVDDYKRQETLKFAGNKIEQAGKGYDGKESTAAGTYSTSGAMITISVTCPGAQSVALPYTATPTEFWMFDVSDGNKEVHVYTKRP